MSIFTSLKYFRMVHSQWYCLLAAYLGLVRPLLEYDSQAWDPYTEIQSNEIETTQRRAARFVTSDYHNYELGSGSKLLEDLGWKSLKNKRKVDRLCILKKELDKNATLPLDDLLKPVKRTRHMHNTQQILYHNLCSHKHFQVQF